jgi:Plasmid pRiA4b ORF-3-like protein
MVGGIIFGIVGEKDRRAVALELDARSRHGGGMKDLIIRVSITLLDVDPAIWRRIEAPANVTLEGLHDVIQVVMGWADHHLHHFQIGSVLPSSIGAGGPYSY